MRDFTTLSIVQRLWFAVLLALLASVSFIPTTAAQGEDQPQLTVVAQALNVRGGPGVDYPAVTVLSQGDRMAIVGYDATTNWWQVQLPNGNSGWVSGGAAYVSVSRNITDMPEVAASQTKQTIDNSEPKAPYGQLTIDNSQLTSTLVFQTVSGGPIYAINPDGTNLRYLTTGIDPALSPDGQWVAFTRWDNPQIGALGSLWVINIDGSSERLLLEGIHQPKAPVWSPDGTQIILSMTYGERLTTERRCSGQLPRDATDVEVKTEGKDDIVYCFTLLPKPFWGMRLVNVATGQFEDLNLDTNSISPTWDPANPWRLIYDGGWGLVSLDLTQRKSWPLTTDVQDHSPTISPDGSKIAVSYRQGDHWDIHVLNADGSGRIRLTETSYLTWVEQELRGETPHSWNNAAPAWSPDGRQIAFLTDRTGHWEIWVMNAECVSPPEGCGSNQRPLFPAEVLAGVALQYNGVDERVLSWR